MAQASAQAKPEASPQLSSLPGLPPRGLEVPNFIKGYPSVSSVICSFGSMNTGGSVEKRLQFYLTEFAHHDSSLFRTWLKNNADVSDGLIFV